MSAHGGTNMSHFHAVILHVGKPAQGGSMPIRLHYNFVVGLILFHYGFEILHLCYGFMVPGAVFKKHAL